MNHMIDTGSRVKDALQLRSKRDKYICFAHVHERVLL